MIARRCFIVEVQTIYGMLFLSCTLTSRLFGGSEISLIWGCSSAFACFFDSHTLIFDLITSLVVETFEPRRDTGRRFEIGVLSFLCARSMESCFGRDLLGFGLKCFRCFMLLDCECMFCRRNY